MSDRLIVQVIRYNHITVASENQVAEAMATFGGTVIGGDPTSGSYTIQFPVTTHEGLSALSEIILDEYPDLFSRVDFSFAFSRGAISTGQYSGGNWPTNDPWWSAVRTPSWWPFRGYYLNWGHGAINTFGAWSASRFAQSYQRTVNVGILDTGVRYTHEDLRIPAQNVQNLHTISGYYHNHGTQVMGVIAAIHDNNLGIAGVANINRNNLFSYNVADENGIILMDNLVYGLR